MIRHLLCGLANSSALFSLSHISPHAVASAPSLFSSLNRAVDGISSFGSFAAVRRASTQSLEPVSPNEPVPKGEHVYTLEIVTGNLRGAGTLTPATVQVCGEHGCTNTFLVGTGGGADGEEGDVGFEKASVKKYMFHADHDLGRLKRVMVEKRQHSMTELDASGWFLERIVVGTPDGEAVNFPCQSWLGQSNFNDSRGELYRNLSPCVVPLSMELPPSPVSVISGGVAIPHPDKLKEGLRGSCTREFGYAGEDAYFCTSGKNGVHGMGVADGVYMWRNLGIDSGIFSRNLAATARHMVEQGYLDVMNVLSFTSRHVRSEGVFGSSTICLVTIDRTVGRLNSANLGDSGFMVIGNSEQRNKPHIKFRTPQLEHQFGWPFQIGHTENADQPGDAMQATLRIVPGDLIVMGTDGLFDNVHDEDIMAACLKGKADGMRPMALAQSLANLAHTNSWSSDLVTPYSMAATEEFNMVYAGGKKDDITVVVAFVGEPVADKEKRRQPGQSHRRT